ncbi:MAG: hypothetical protein ACR2MM_02495, partial [Flavobacteriaceae bacterium]
MNKYSVIVLVFFLSSCSNYGQLTFVSKLPKKLDENSGMVHLKDSTVWLINDSGGADKIYQVNFKGDLLREIRVEDAKNKDWEDLAKDEDGNVFIGDIGNNNSRRKNLRVYKIPNPESEDGDQLKAKKIEFNYPEQKKFPPKRKDLKYDAEAMFYREGNLFIITKNRAKPFDGEAFIYKIPAKKGKHDATLVGSFTPCKEYATCRITSADISPDGQKIVLLSYGKLWIYTGFSEDDFTKGTLRFINLGSGTQLE